jgi:hypothetical protein
MSFGTPAYAIPARATRPAGQITASITANAPGLAPVPGVPGLQPLQPLAPLPSAPGGGGASFGLNMSGAAPATPAAPVAPTAPAAPAYPVGYAAPTTPVQMVPGATTIASLNAQGQLVDQSGNLMRDAMGNPIYGTVGPSGQLIDSAGNVITDAAGNPILYSGHTYHSGKTALWIGIAVVAAIVAGTAFVGSYYGTKKAEQPLRSQRAE